MVLSPRERTQLNARPPARAQSPSTSGETNTKSNPKPKSDNVLLRYPYEIMFDSTDYLKIQIAEYQPPGLDLSGVSEDAKDKDGNVITRKVNGKTINTQTVKTDFSLETSTDKNSQSLKNAKTTIYLPIPQQLSDTMSANWGDGGLNALEAFGVATAEDVMTEGLDGLLNSFQTLKDNAGILGNENVRRSIIAALSGRALGALGGNVSGSQLVSRATGQVFNPNLELLFDGVNLRSFPFTFEFFSRNEKEAQEVKSIIRTLKKSMTAKKTGTQKIFIKAPDVFQLTYMKGNRKHPFLNTFLPMALVNMNLTYTGSNTYSTFYDGTPSHIRMDLVFKELNPVYAEDYDGDDAKIGVGY